MFFFWGILNFSRNTKFWMSRLSETSFQYFDWTSAPKPSNLSGLKRAAAILRDHLKENRSQNSSSLCPRLCIEVKMTKPRIETRGKQSSPAKPNSKGKAKEVDNAKSGSSRKLRILRKIKSDSRNSQCRRAERRPV
jgi:hypothetical protein